MATFYIEAIENTDIALVKVGSPTIGTVKYGINDSTCPNTYTVTTASTPISLTAGQKCYWTITSTTTAFSMSNYLKFTSTAKINVGGNLSDLIGGSTKIPRNYCFYRLFSNCTELVDTSNLVVVNDFNSRTYCYGYMFFGCKSLTTAPALPATTLTNNCYQAMFNSCTSLATLPALPATTLTSSCYQEMFRYCSNIKLSETQTAPYSIPYIIPSAGAGTAGTNSLSSMFSNTGGTFKGAPTINTTYYFAPYATFYIEAIEDTDITLSKVGTPTVGDAHYGVNDHNVPNTYVYGNTIHLTVGQKCYWFITSTSTDFSESNYLNFTSTAKINVGGNLSDLIGGDTKIPRNYCFYSLFHSCTDLIDASNLVVVNDFNSKTWCYYYMFFGCTSLTSSPQLPATTLTPYCYLAMFQGCTSLISPPQLPATTLVPYCYGSMFNGCSNIRLSDTQIAPYFIPYRIPSEGTGTMEMHSSTSHMFASTGGTFIGTPNINTTYYLAPYATFYIEAIEDTDITLSKVGTPTVGDACYGVENHNVPNAYTYGDTVHLTAGQKCYWFITNTSTNFTSYNYLKFTSTTKINAGGNLSDLIGGNTKIPRGYCFNRLFYNCTNLVSASDLVLASDFNSKDWCYSYMFEGCTSLTTTPALPAATLTDYCYGGIFEGCTSLTAAPELPATALADGCYYRMFYDCTSLTATPVLPATTLATQCYESMFQNCTSLTAAPKLPATTLADGCYYQMFSNCTSLATASELPAITLTDYCYGSMFNGCTSLTIPPALPATTLADYCYSNMFEDCINIRLSETQTEPYSIPYIIPSEGIGTEGTDSLGEMFTNTGGTFTGTPNINTTYYLAIYATFYIEAIEDTDITLSKVGTPVVGDAYYGVNDHAVPNTYTYDSAIHLIAGQKCYWFIMNTSTNFDPSNCLKFTSTGRINVGGALSDLIGGTNTIQRNYCFYGLFDACTNLVDASSLVLASDLNSKTWCYGYMFRNCASLTSPPVLPAMTLTNYCYSNMFQSCTSLTTAPELPATALANNCYEWMFYNCKSLVTAPEKLPATILAYQCYGWMFQNCASLTTLPELPATTLTSSCYRYMFASCTNIKLSETQTSPYSIPYRIPSEGTGTVGTNSFDNMFTGTGGTFTGTPTINTTYYFAPPYSPIFITYKDQELANFESGSKTLKCGNKYMEDDIIITREIGTNDVVVLYNSGTILTFQNGTKTLKCAGNCMATDLDIQIS